MVTGPSVRAARCAASPSTPVANSSVRAASPSNNPTKSSNGAAKCAGPVTKCAGPVTKCAGPVTKCASPAAKCAGRATKCGNFGTGDGKNDWKWVKKDEKHLPTHENGQKTTVRPSADVPAEEKRRRTAAVQDAGA